MTSILRQAVYALTALILSIVAGCGPRKQAAESGKPLPQGELGTTIGMLAEVFASDTIPVRGYALVGELNGTGSSECPTPVRVYLEKYILQQLAGTKKVTVEELISSPDTAVVMVEGLIPAAASRDQRFDVRVLALPGTSTTSIEGGWLYGADLYQAQRFTGAIKPLANAEGQVFTDTIDTSNPNKKAGYIIGGGKVLDDYKINLALRRADFKLASDIRNRVNELFGYETAWALSAGQIELRVPAKYTGRKERFIQVVKATFLGETPELTEKRIMTFVQRLAGSQDKAASEIALEAIGNASTGKLTALLNSSNEEVRLRAGRCMLNLGDQRGLETLQKIALDKRSSYRVEAMEAIVGGVKPKVAAPIARELIRDDDFAVRLIAYENLKRIDDLSITSARVANAFYLEQISQSGKPAIYVSRSGQPRIVLFGAPIYCRDNLFVQSQDSSITINAPSGQGYVTILCRHPTHPDLVVQLRSTFELGDIIRTLCDEPQSKGEGGQKGLGVSYSAVAALLKQMSDKGAVEAEFHAGALPKIGLNIKK